MTVEFHDVELVFESVDIEEVANLDVAGFDDGIEEEWCGERNVCAADLELELLDEVDVGR